MSLKRLGACQKLQKWCLYTVSTGKLTRTALQHVLSEERLRNSQGSHVIGDWGARELKPLGGWGARGEWGRPLSPWHHEVKTLPQIKVRNTIDA